MSTEKKYRLLKDLPDSKVGDEYIWNNSMEAYYKNGNVQDSYWNGEAIENNPEWFEEVIPNKQRVNGWYLVMDDRKIWYPCKFTDGYWWLNPDFPKVNDTFFRNINEIKQPTPTTASVLNNDADTVVEDSLPKNIEAEYYKTLKELETTEWLLEERQKILDAIPECEVHGKCVPHALDWVEMKKSKIYSQSEVDAMCKETFYAGRQTDEENLYFDGHKFLYYEDYLSSINSSSEVLDNGNGKEFIVPQPKSEPLHTEDKGWEIVSYKGKSTGLIYTLINNEWTPQSGYVPFLNNKEGIEKSGCEIHSVRRTSDNEVFTVGDKIGWGTDGSYETTLTGFEIQDGRLKFNDERRSDHLKFTDFLNAVRLHKKPSTDNPNKTVIV